MKLKQLLKNPKVLVSVIAAIVILAVTGVVLAAHFQASRPEVKESPPTQTTTEKESETETEPEPEMEEETEPPPPIGRVEDFLDCLVAKKSLEPFVGSEDDRGGLSLAELLSGVEIKSYTLSQITTPLELDYGDNFSDNNYFNRENYFHSPAYASDPRKSFEVYLNITKSDVREFPVGKQVKFWLTSYEYPGYPISIEYFHLAEDQELNYREKRNIEVNHNRVLWASTEFMGYYLLCQSDKIVTGDIVVTNKGISPDPEISGYKHFETEFMIHYHFKRFGGYGDHGDHIPADEYCVALNKYFRVKDYDITKVPTYRSDTDSVDCAGGGGPNYHISIQKYKYDESTRTHFITFNLYADYLPCVVAKTVLLTVKDNNDGTVFFDRFDVLYDSGLKVWGFWQ